MRRRNRNNLVEALELLLLALLLWNFNRIYGQQQDLRPAVGMAETETAGTETQDGARGETDPWKERKKICLSFDDGPDPRYTPQLLDGLAQRKVKASFFLTGKKAEEYPELVKRLQEEGHLIGNHTYSHLQLTRNNREQFKQELEKTNGIIEQITGEEVLFVRPPYGCWEKSLEEELNLFPVLWNIDPLDWCSSDASRIVERVLSGAKENAIILMHDEFPSTVTAALRVVDELQKEGYEFVTVDEVLFE